MALSTSERGTQLDGLLYTLDGELFDPSEVTVLEIDNMLETDSQAMALEQGLTLPIQGLRGDLEPASGDRGEAEWAREVLLSPPNKGGPTTPMSVVVNQMSGAISRRRAYFEKVWKKNPDGRHSYHKIAWRPEQTCNVRVDKNGSFDGFHQHGVRADGGIVDEKFDPDKAFVYIHRNDKHPLIGRSAFQTAYKNYVDKMKVQRLYHIHLQNFALGTVKGKYSGTDGRRGSRKFFDKLKSFRGGGGVVVFQEGEDAEISQGHGAGEEFQAALQYMDTQMAGSVLLRFLNMGTDDNTGNRALSREHHDFYLQSLSSIVRDMEEAISNHLISPMVEYAYGKDAEFPRWKFDPLSVSDREMAVDIWKGLVAVAGRPTGEMWNQIEEKVAKALSIDPDTIEKDRPAPISRDQAKSDYDAYKQRVEEENKRNGTNGQRTPVANR